MRCPHCSVSFHDHPTPVLIGKDKDGGWAIIRQSCPECKRLVLVLANGPVIELQRQFHSLARVDKSVMVYPKASQRAPAPKEVPAHIAEDYSEACLVLPDSAKASAALARRCLQSVLRETAQVKKGDLSHEIQQVLDAKTLPSHLADSVDAIRNIGNFAAHPQKSLQSGAVLPVEPGEAEWTLDVLETLFDFYYVQPALLKSKRDALNAKLAEAGKPSMK